MKAKHIISAVLIVVLPFVIILGFGALSSYFDRMGGRTYMFSYSILSMLVTAIPLVSYIFWLSFVMRTKNRKPRMLLNICSFATAAFLIISYFGYWIVPFPCNTNFVSTTAIVCILANLFAGIYMLVKRKKYEEN